MTAGPDDDLLDPDLFLRRALEKKIESINRGIEELLSSGKNQEKTEALLTARAQFHEILRSPRLYLAKPPGIDAASAGLSTSVLAGAAAETVVVPPAAAAPPEAAVPPKAAAPPEAAVPPRPAIPLGAIPQPRRVGAAPEPPVGARRQTSPVPKVTSPAEGMMSFLKSVQAEGGAKPPAGISPATASAAPQTPASASAPQPQAAPVLGKGMMSFLKSVQSTQAVPGAILETTAPGSASAPVAAAAPSPIPSPTPTASAPALIPSAVSGPMLSFLEKVRGAGGEVPAPSRAQDVLPAIERSAILHDLKERAASSGFKDIYEMLRFKRLRLVENRARLMQSADATTRRVVAVLDREINEIDSLLKQRPEEIIRKVEEFSEVAAVDKGGLAAITTELQGLFDEIK
jgi:hypothetical protein